MFRIYLVYLRWTCNLVSCKVLGGPQGSKSVIVFLSIPLTFGLGPGRRLLIYFL